MPFGLRNALATSQKTMTQHVVVGDLREFAMVYLNDIIVHSDNFEKYPKHLAGVFKRL